MVEEENDERKSNYLPFFTLIKGTDYKQLFKAPHGIDVYQSLSKKFGDFGR